MQEYIERLIHCGYTKEKAYSLCADFMRNLPLFNLQLFVESIEEEHHVGKIQSESNRQACR